MRIKQKPGTIFFFLVLALVLTGISCDNGSSNIRKYKGKGKSPTVKPAVPQPEVPAGQPKRAHFQWDTPEGWNERRAVSGFRLAAFTIKSGNKESICTIIPLQGEAGGLKANAARWLGQIKDAGTAMAARDTLEKLLKTKEKFLTRGRFPAVMLDYTPLTPNPGDQSIIVSVITVMGNSIFIKMIGEKSHLLENKEKFKALCRSFTITSTSGSPPKSGTKENES